MFGSCSEHRAKRCRPLDLCDCDVTAARNKTTLRYHIVLSSKSGKGLFTEADAQFVGSLRWLWTDEPKDLKGKQCSLMC